MVQSQPATLETDTVFALLSNATRRTVLRYLREVERASARELAGHLAPSTDDDGSRRGAQVELVHHHLPRLAASGVVDYDGPAGDVALGPSFDEIEPFVARLEESDTDRAS